MKNVANLNSAEREELFLVTARERPFRRLSSRRTSGSAGRWIICSMTPRGRSIWLLSLSDHKIGSRLVERWLKIP